MGRFMAVVEIYADTNVNMKMATSNKPTNEPSETT